MIWHDETIGQNTGCMPHATHLPHAAACSCGDEMRANSVGDVVALNLYISGALLKQEPLACAVARRPPAARDKHDGRGALRCQPARRQKPETPKAPSDHMGTTHLVDLRG